MARALPGSGRARRDALAAWREVRRRMPASVRAAIPTAEVVWDRDRLWALALPVEPVAIADLAWMLDLPLWSDRDLPWQVTPNQVRADAERYAGQYRRTLESDLCYPIHLVVHRGRWTILDGVHRLLKADIQGWPTLPAMRLSAADLDQIVVARY